MPGLAEGCRRPNEQAEKERGARRNRSVPFLPGSEVLSDLDPDGSAFRAQEGKQSARSAAAQCGKRQHQQEKFVQFQAGKRVQIKILRISDRGEHTSQISRDCHQDDQITDSRFHTGHLQDQDAEWHKGDEGDVISDEHTAHKA